MHLVIPGMMVIQLEEEEGSELKIPWRLEDLDKDDRQEVESRLISSAAPEKSGRPPGRKVGGVAF